MKRSPLSTPRLTLTPQESDAGGCSYVVAAHDNPDDHLATVTVEFVASGRIASLRYDLADGHRRGGVVSEATQAVVASLFERDGVVRVESLVEVDDYRTLRVMERCGLLFEGVAQRAGFAAEVGPVDRWQCGVGRAQWHRWVERDQSTPASVELVALDATNRDGVVGLTRAKSHERFGPSAAEALALELAPPSKYAVALEPWSRVVVADGVVVGYVLAWQHTAAHPNPVIEVLVMDRWHTGRGIEVVAIGQVAAWFADAGADNLEVHWTEGPGSPKWIYEACGFEPTGRRSNAGVQALKPLV